MNGLLPKRASKAGLRDNLGMSSSLHISQDELDIMIMLIQQLPSMYIRACSFCRAVDLVGGNVVSVVYLSHLGSGT